MKKTLLLFYIVALNISASAQLVTTPNNNAAQLAQSLVGPGVIVQNASLSGSYLQNTTGTFTATNSNLGISSGIVLSSGYVTSIPSTSGSVGSDNTCSGCNDADLLQLAQLSTGGTTVMRDAVYLEFDVFSIGDTLKFNYVFASMEYPDFVCSQYNDMFGFFISGPGVTGPYSGNSKNIALIPGTTLPVGINTVNVGQPGPFYQSSGCLSLNYSQFFNVNNATSNSFIYDGYTTVLTAVAVVQPCNWYHLKLKIADGNDQNLDSGVFIEAGSLISTGLQLTASTTVGQGYPYAVEGCNDAVFTFRKPVPDTVAHTYPFQIGGSAINGTDYPFLPDSVIFLPGDTTVQITITAIADGINEGTETIKFYIVDPCYGNKLDSATIMLVDSIPAFNSGDTIICQGDSLQLNAGGAVNYLWTPSLFLNIDTVSNPMAKPAVTTTYTIQHKVGQCTSLSNLKVQVNPAPPLEAGPDTSVCIGKNVQLNATGANIYTWSPPMGLSNPNIANPLAGPLFTTTYYITGKDSVGCTSKDTLKLTVNPIPTVSVTTPDTTICAETPTQIHATGGVNYSWEPVADFQDPSVQSPFVTPAISPTIYTVTVTDANGCSNTDNVKISLFPFSDPLAAPDTSVCPFEPVQLSAQNGNTYSWSPSNYLDDPNIANPIFSSDQSETYVVTITDANNCESKDTINITVNGLPTADAGLTKYIYLGEQVILNGSGGTSYSWAPPGSLDNPTAQSPTASPVLTTTYTVTVTDVNGCDDMDTVTIFVEKQGELFMPSAFSPNGDAHNEIFKPVIKNVFETYTFVIFNRWGQQVFATSDPDEGWDGKYKGDMQPIGTYVYFIKAVNALGDEVNETGNVTLIR